MRKNTFFTEELKSAKKKRTWSDVELSEDGQTKMSTDNMRDDYSMKSLKHRPL